MYGWRAPRRMRQTNGAAGQSKQASWSSKQRTTTGQLPGSLAPHPPAVQILVSGDRPAQQSVLAQVRPSTAAGSGPGTRRRHPRRTWRPCGIGEQALAHGGRSRGPQLLGDGRGPHRGVIVTGKPLPHRRRHVPPRHRPPDPRLTVTRQNLQHPFGDTPAEVAHQRRISETDPRHRITGKTRQHLHIGRPTLHRPQPVPRLHRRHQHLRTPCVQRTPGQPRRAAIGQLLNREQPRQHRCGQRGIPPQPSKPLPHRPSPPNNPTLSPTPTTPLTPRPQPRPRPASPATGPPHPASTAPQPRRPGTATTTPSPPPTAPPR